MVVALNKPTKQIWAASESPWSYFRSQESNLSPSVCSSHDACLVIFLPLFFSVLCVGVWWVCGQRVASSQIIHKTQASDSTGGKISLPCPCLAWPLSSSWLCSCLPPPHTQARSLANNMPWWWCNPKKLGKKHCVCINEWPEGLTLHFCYFYSMSWWGVSENQ
jgi:hypothetical protein